MENLKLETNSWLYIPEVVYFAKRFAIASTEDKSDRKQV